MSYLYTSKEKNLIGNQAGDTTKV